MKLQLADQRFIDVVLVQTRDLSNGDANKRFAELVKLEPKRRRKRLVSLRDEWWRQRVTERTGVAPPERPARDLSKPKMPDWMRRGSLV